VSRGERNRVSNHLKFPVNCTGVGSASGQISSPARSATSGRSTSPPVELSEQRRRDYTEFCTEVVNELRGTSPILEAEFDAARELAVVSVAH
jgi:hypothetical protein